MASQLAVTVIIPVYNGAEYLAETIESVLAQSLPPAAVLVIDDGSSDDSASIVRAYEPRVRLYSRSNAGVSASRNFGAQEAETEWIHFLDQDDVWLPDHLALQKGALMRQLGADACYTGRRNLVRSKATGTFVPTGPVAIPTPEEYVSTVMDRCPGNPSTICMRRSAFLAAGGFNGQYDSIEDWDLWIRLVQHGVRFACSPEPSVLYRVHDASATNNPLPVLKRSAAVVRQTVMPKLPFTVRHLHGQRVISRLEGEAAILLRQNRLPGALPLMLKSIARHPFHEARRYKIATHMLLQRLKAA